MVEISKCVSACNIKFLRRELMLRSHVPDVCLEGLRAGNCPYTQVKNPWRQVLYCWPWIEAIVWFKCTKNGVNESSGVLVHHIMKCRSVYAQQRNVYQPNMGEKKVSRLKLNWWPNWTENEMPSNPPFPRLWNFCIVQISLWWPLLSRH